jgi:hypothetical protein
MSSYSLNPNNVPPTNYNTQAPVKRVSTNTTPTPPAVAKAPPAPSEPQSLVTPKNIAIGAGALAALTMVGMGIRNRNFKFWENAVDLEKKNLENTAQSLKEEIAQQANKIDELEKSGGSEKPPSYHDFDDVDDLNSPVEDTNPAKEKGWFQWPFSGKAEKKKPPVAPPSKDIVISFDTPSKPNLWQKLGWQSTPKAAPITHVDPTNLPAEFASQRLIYDATGGVFKRNGRSINAEADGIANRIHFIQSGRSPSKTFQINPQYKPNVDVKVDETLLKNYGDAFLAVHHKGEKVITHVPIDVDSKNVPAAKMREWVEKGLFALPPGSPSYTDASWASKTFSIPQGGFPHKVSYTVRGIELADQLPGFLIPNP